jgi:hypothetical protein
MKGSIVRVLLVCYCSIEPWVYPCANTNIIIIFIIIIFVLVLIIFIILPTLMIITTSFTFVPFELLVTVWVCQLYRMHIHRLVGFGKIHSLSCCRWVKRQIFQLVHHQVYIFSICGAYHVVGMRPRILSRIIIGLQRITDNFIKHPRLSIYKVQLLDVKDGLFLRCHFKCRNILQYARKQEIEELFQYKL